jgi:hypothetical protein
VTPAIVFVDTGMRDHIAIRRLLERERDVIQSRRETVAARIARVPAVDFTIATVTLAPPLPPFVLGGILETFERVFDRPHHSVAAMWYEPPVERRREILPRVLPARRTWSAHLRRAWAIARQRRTGERRCAILRARTA